MKNKEAKSIFSSLENLSSTPPPELWDKIEAQLDKPKKKKSAIIWWWAAACLVAGLSVPTIWYVSSNQENKLELNIQNNTNEVVLQNDSKNDVNRNKSINPNESAIGKATDEPKSNNVIENTKVDGIAIDKSSDDKIKNSINKVRDEKINTKESHISLTNRNSVATKESLNVSSENEDSRKLTNSKKEKHNQFIAGDNTKSQSDAIVANKSATIGNSKSASTSVIGINNFSELSNSNENPKIIVTSENNSISESKQNNKSATTGNSKSGSTSVIGVNNFSELSNSNGNPKIIATSESNSISESKQNKKDTESTNVKSVPVIQNVEVSGLNTNNGIAENANAKDSVAKIKKEVEQLENALVTLDKDKTKKKDNSEVIDKWSLQVFAGVMASENYNNEKALGYTVAPKQSNGYGVKTNYKLNKKWAVSSGFKINELGQKIEGVSYYERPNVQTLRSGPLTTVPDGTQLTAKSNNIVFVSNSNSEDFLFAANSKADTGFETGNVTQNLKYFEMPVEVSYALLSKKKTNISMNTGGFVGRLISNEVLLNGSSIGENKNVNEFVYGTLLSSTLQYEFYKKTKFFIEPGMNYYINPLENQSFNQFQWMFNIGLNVSF